MNRITVEAVKAAYEKTGRRPIRSLMDDKCGGSCALGVLHLASGDGGRDGYAWAERNFGGQYYHGFYRGFDGNESRGIDNPEWLLGRDDGRACAAAIFGDAK